MKSMLIVSVILVAASSSLRAEAPTTEPSTQPAAAIELTPAAVAAIRVTIAQQKMDLRRVYVRVGVKVDGEQFRYILDLDERDREPGDIDVRTGGLLVRVHKSAMPLLRGTTIDFKDRDGARGFVFHNPNAKESAE